jgi:hypothetical protein
MIKNELGPNDLTYYKDGSGLIKAGGFSINSDLLKHNQSPMAKGGKKENNDENRVSVQFSSMVIPAGLLFLHHNNEYGPVEMCEMDNVVPDDLYSRLVSLAEIKENQKKLSRSKKTKTNKGKKTRVKKQW